MKQKNLLWTYVLLIALQFLHSIEEIKGKAAFIDPLFKGTGNFIIINLVILFVLVMLLYCTMKGKKLAYFLSYGYAFLMIVNGLYHIFTLSTGIYTGTGLVVISLLLIYNLKMNKNQR